MTRGPLPAQKGAEQRTAGLVTSRLCSGIAPDGGALVDSRGAVAAAATHVDVDAPAPVAGEVATVTESVQDATALTATPGVPLEVYGRPDSHALPGLRTTLLRVLLGWALLVGSARVVLWFLGYRRRGKLLWDGVGLHYSQRMSLLGITLLERDEYVPESQLEHLRIERRAPFVGHLLTLLLFGVLMYLGGLLLVDGMLLGESRLWSAALALVLVGASLDLVLLAGTSRLQHRTVLEVRGQGRLWSLRGVQEARARTFLAALRGATPELPEAPQGLDAQTRSSCPRVASAPLSEKRV